MDRSTPRIRPLALAVIRKGDLLFVSESHDPVKNETFYRPLGGGIEFGEKGADAVVREFQEELGAEITNVRYLGLCENIFTYRGYSGHEIVLMFEADFADAEFYEERERWAMENGKSVVKAVWVPIAKLMDGNTRFYPHGIAELLARHWEMYPT